MSTMKRPLEDDADDSHAPPPSWWTEAVKWIEENGGMVHSSIAMSIGSSYREPQLRKDLPKDTVLMKIPTSTCVVSRETVEATPLGKKLATLIRAVSSERETHNAEQDLLVALYLAFLHVVKKENEAGPLRARAYLDTLPSSSEFDALPRRWSERNLTDLLTGSCLLDRVRKSQLALQDEFERLRKAWTSTAGPDACPPFPPLSTIDDMMAAVTSRAFSGVASADCLDGDIAMVPLLDLCNHHRGRDVEKNLSYTVEGAAIVVRAHMDLKVNDTLRITYGARGNAQLLFNYGFCIRNNIEPDGSSNDVFEFQLHTDLPPVELRTGPKSYSFGGFVKALERFHEGAPEEQQVSLVGDSHEDDMEAFLNECDKDECGGWGDDEQDEEDEIFEEKANIEAEVRAMTAFKDSVAKALSRYSLPRREATENSDIERFARILISSEHRTLIFYRTVTDCIISKLMNQNGTSCIKDFSFFGSELYADGDAEMLDKQVEELADAFVRIRYSLLS